MRQHDVDYIQKINGSINQFEFTTRELDHLLDDGEKTEIAAAIKTMYKLLEKVKQGINDRDESLEKRQIKHFMGYLGRYTLHIGEAIAHAERNQKNAERNHEAAVEDLTKRGYAVDEARQLLADSKPDVGLIARKIAFIKDEQRKVEQFMKDYPRYDMAILEGTRFAGWTPENNPYFDPCNPDYAPSKRLVTHRLEIEQDSYGLFAAAGIQ